MAEKKCRWRKDKKEARDEDQAAPERKGGVLPSAGVLSENLAAAHAFRGLHGVKTNFSLISGAADNAYHTVLGGNAHYYESILCDAHDFTLYEALVDELEYGPCWMRGGNPLFRPTALGGERTLKRSPTYERILRWMAGYFKVEPVRSIVNYYRNGDDYTSLHSDQYFSGQCNMTIGASFGEERGLLFEHKDSKEQFRFPQHNGDIFAFTAEVNDQFYHAVPREKRRARSTSSRHTLGRVSVILWARRPVGEERLAPVTSITLLPNPHVLDYDPYAEGAKENVERLGEERVQAEQTARDEAASALKEEAERRAREEGERSAEEVAQRRPGADVERIRHDEGKATGNATYDAGSVAKIETTSAVGGVLRPVAASAANGSPTLAEAEQGQNRASDAPVRGRVWRGRR